MDPYLEGVGFEQCIRCLSGFAAQIRQGGYSRGRTVKSDTVSTALSAIGKEVSLVSNVNPIKQMGSDKLLPLLAQMLDGWRKVDGPVLKKLPVEADVPESMVK